MREYRKKTGKPSALVEKAVSKELDKEIEALKQETAELQREAEVIAKIEEREAMLETPFMLGMRNILVENIKTHNLDIEKKLVSNADILKEEAMDSFTEKMREILYPSSGPSVKESELESIIAKILGEKKPDEEKPKEKKEDESGMVV